MSGRGPRWIGGPKWPKYTVNISGYLNGNYGYATIDETEYTEKTTLKVKRYTEIQVYVSSYSSSLRENCQVTFNGTVVQSGAGLYTFIAKSDIAVEFTRTKSGSTYYYTCDITTV